MLLPVAVQVSLEFRGNKATVASAVYINNLDLCSWSPRSYDQSLFQTLFPDEYNRFDRRNVFYWNFINYTLVN